MLLRCLSGWDRLGKQKAFTGAVKELHRAITERNQVLSLQLHVLCRRDPKLLALFDLARASQDHFLGASGRQNRKFERARGGAFHLAKLFHKRRQFGIRQRRMVFDLPHLRKLGQQLIEVVPPAGGILPSR